MSRAILRRRELMKGLTAAGFLVRPLFRDSFAEAAGFPVRFIVLQYPGGTWYPTSRGPNPGSLTFDKVLAPLAPLQSEILTFSNFENGCTDGNNEPHGAGMKTMLTGDPFRAPKTSVDQVIADAIGQTTKFSSLQFGVGTDLGVGSRGCSFRNGSEQPTVPDPAVMFTRLFGGGAPAPVPPPPPSGGGAATPPAPVAPAPSGGTNAADRRRSMLDLLKGEVTALKRVAGTREQQKLDQHMTSLRELEKQVATISPAGTTAPGATTNPTGPATAAPTTPMPGVGCASPGASSAAKTDVPAIMKAQLELLYQALVCDLTRVATLQFLRSAQDEVGMPWLGITKSHHTLEHEQLQAPNGAELNKVQTWFMEQVAGFCNRLKATPEGSGNMLDNSLVVVVSEIANGEQHTHDFLPITIGRAGGTVRPGRNIAGKLYQPHSGLLMGFAAAFGITLTRMSAGEQSPPVPLG